LTRKRKRNPRYLNEVTTTAVVRLFLQGPHEPKHRASAEQNYAAQPKHEHHSFIKKLVNSTPPTTSAIQTRLFELKESHCVQLSDTDRIQTPIQFETN
jgi:hypothetical protein